jgi:hypothetical protein
MFGGIHSPLRDGAGYACKSLIDQAAFRAGVHMGAQLFGFMSGQFAVRHAAYHFSVFIAFLHA